MAKVCILTAGKGTRMGPYAAYANKGILPIKSKAILTHIIERFPVGTEYVVALGHLKEQVTGYLKIAHPDVTITYVNVDNYDGPGSGPGYSLSCCREHLLEPFYFVACDTLWTNELAFTETVNWFGVARVSEEKSSVYCNFVLETGKVVAIKDKQRVNPENHAAFVGLCHIQDYEIFWQGLNNKETVAGEVQVSNGLQALVDQAEVTVKEIDWIDLGDHEKYKEAVSRYENYDFSKSDEFLYITGEKVIKFFANQDVTARRVQKASLNPEVFPPITEYEGQFYAYPFIPGSTMYAHNGPDLFKAFLKFMDEKVWKLRIDSDSEMIASICKKFYFDKTKERVDKYYTKYPDDPEPSLIRGVKVPPLKELLDQVPWEEFYQGIPSFIHGDLQFDNILSTPEGGFVLLDWRQEFGGVVEFGDIYYDLGKLSGGILLNYDYIKLNLLTYSEEDEKVEFDFATRFGGPDYLSILESFVKEKGWDLRKVRLLVPIIYLNMSPLHHHPFDKMLFALGKLLLFKRLNETY
ncbi:MAG: NTP transferase domain-containing protein [Sedimenticola sp.]